MTRRQALEISDPLIKDVDLHGWRRGTVGDHSADRNPGRVEILVGVRTDPHGRQLDHVRPDRNPIGTERAVGTDRDRAEVADCAVDRVEFDPATEDRPPTVADNA